MCLANLLTVFVHFDCLVHACLEASICWDFFSLRFICSPLRRPLEAQYQGLTPLAWVYLRDPLLFELEKNL